MRRDDALALLQAHLAEFQRLGVRSLAIFGSVARDEARLDSDVDVLVEFSGPAIFAGYMDLKFMLEALLERPVDLATTRALKPALRRRIESDLQRVS